VVRARLEFARAGRPSHPSRIAFGPYCWVATGWSCLLICGSIVLALLDLVMPRADAIAVIDATRMLRPDLPILPTSGYAEGIVLERLGGRTIQGFLPRHWGLPLLIETVRRTLAGLT